MATQGISGAGRAELTTVAGRRRFVTPDDVTAELGVEPSVAAKKLAHWADSGWLRRVRRGLYIPVPVDAERPSGWAADPLVVATEVWGPCYFTGWTAASHWSLTEQVFRTIVLKTSRRVRAAESRLLDHDYLVGHVSGESMSWGMESLWREETRVRFADPARTVVDVLDTPRLGGGIRHVAEILDVYLTERDGLRLVDYGDRLGNGAVFKRLGYLIESLGGDQAELLEACRARRSAGVVLLDPDGPTTGARVPAWGLRANVHVGRVAPS